MRRAAQKDPGYPAILFVHQGGISDGERFFAAFWPGARGIADSDSSLYRAFGLERGTVRQVFGLRVWLRVLLALLQGHLGGRPVGDPWMMPGAFLVRDGRVVWEHRARHVGDQPHFRRIPEHLERAGGAPSPA